MKTSNPLGLQVFDVAEYLDSEELIVEFLNSVLQDNDPELLVSALGAIARARVMASLAAGAGLSRESLYKVFKPGAHPRFDTMFRVMNALGIGLSAKPLAMEARIEMAYPAEAQRPVKAPAPVRARTARKPAQPGKKRKSHEAATAPAARK